MICSTTGLDPLTDSLPLAASHPGYSSSTSLLQHTHRELLGLSPPGEPGCASRGLSALQGLSTLWALISEGTAARFGVAHAVQASWDTALSMLGVRMEGDRDVPPSEGCSGSKVPGHLWQRVSSADTRQAWMGCLIKCEEFSHFTSCSPHCSMSDSGKESFY